MAVGEEIEALEAHALNPICYQVLQRQLASSMCILVLCGFGELIALSSGWIFGVFVLDVPSAIYIDNTILQLDMTKFLTGMLKAGNFGLVIGGIACHNA